MTENSEPIYSPRENDIFIAYSPEDDFFAKRLEKAIIKLGRDPWIDTQDLPPGLKSDMAEAWEHIKVGIKNADVFVFILSPASIALERNQQELELAAQHQKRLVPIVYQTVDQAEIPDILRTNDATWLSSNSVDPTANIEEIAKTILHIHIHQRLLVRATEWQQSDRTPELRLSGADLEAVRRWFKQNADRHPHLTPLQQQYLNESIQAEDKHTHLKQLDVFISYSRRDREFAEALCNQLKKNHLNIWVDWENIPIAADWRQEIREGIESAHTFLFIISPDSVASPYCHDEIAQAVSNNKRIISIVWRRNYDRDWFEKIPALATIRRHNWLHCNSVDQLDHTTPKLIHAINTDLDYVKAHTRLLLQAIEWKNQERREEFLLRKTELSNAQALLDKGKAIEHHWLSQGRIEKLLPTPLPTDLQEEFVWESAEAEAKIKQQEKKRRRRIQALAGTALFFLGLTVLAISGQLQAQNRQIEALVSSIEGVRELDALINGLRAGQELDRWGWMIERLEPDLRVRVVTALQQQVYNLRELNRLEGHDAAVFNVTHSPDGRFIASASDDGTVRLWNRQGQLIETLEHPAEDERRPSMVHVVFNPGIVSNTYTLASAGNGHTIYLWEISQTHRGRWSANLVQTLQASNAPKTTPANSMERVFSLSFSQGGQVLASGSSDGYVTLWQRNATGQFDQLERMKHGNSSSVLSLSFSRSSQGEMKLAAADAEGKIKVLASNNFFETYTVLQELQHNGQILSLAFSSDGQTLASASANGTIQLWQEDTIAPVQTLEGHEGRVHRVMFSPDDRIVASVSEDGSVRLWQRNNDSWQNPVTPMVLRGHQAPVYRVQFSPNGQTIATAGADDTIRLWTTADGTLLDSLEGHQDEVLSIEFSSDGRTLVSASRDKTIRFWKIDSSIHVLPHANRVYDVSFTSDGMAMASSGQDTIRLWRTSNGTPLLDEPIRLAGAISSIRFAPTGGMTSLEGQLLAATGQDGTINLWTIDRTTSGYRARQIAGQKDFKHEKEVNSLSFSPDGQLLASAGADGTIKVWQIKRVERTYQAVLLTEEAFSGAVRTVSFSPDGKLLAAAGQYGAIKIWQIDRIENTLATKQIHSLQEHQRTVNSVRFNPNGEILASASSDGTVRLWNLAGGTISQSRVLQGHGDEVLKVSFSPTGEFLASASRDDTVKLWTLEGNLITTLREHRREVSSIDFSPDGKLLASTSFDSRALLWQLSENFDLNEFMLDGCRLAHDYLVTTEQSNSMAAMQYRDALAEVRASCQKLLPPEEKNRSMWQTEVKESGN
jgi:WD40 repeat protein